MPINEARKLRAERHILKTGMPQAIRVGVNCEGLPREVAVYRAYGIGMLFGVCGNFYCRRYRVHFDEIKTGGCGDRRGYIQGDSSAPPSPLEMILLKVSKFDSLYVLTPYTHHVNALKF